MTVSCGEDESNSLAANEAKELSGPLVDLLDADAMASRKDVARHRG